MGIRSFLLFSILLFIFSTPVAKAQTGAYLSKIPSSFNLDHLEKELADHSYESLAEFLELLSRKYPNYLKNYTLVFDSKSLQAASPQNPRVLIFGEDASFIMSFNGNPNQRGYQNFEILRFDFEKSEFFFHELTFKKDLEARLQTTPLSEMDGLEREDIAKSNLKVRSPDICMSCHTPNKKPNWDSYPSWPAVFGSDDGKPATLYSADITKENILLAVIENKVSNFMTDDRYKYLPNLEEFLQFPTRFNIEDQPFVNSNLKFTEKLQNLNFKRLTKKWVLSNHFQEHKVALLAALNDCIRDKNDFYNFISSGTMPSSFISSGFISSNDDQDFIEFEELRRDTFRRINANRLLKGRQVYDYEFPDIAMKYKNQESSYASATPMHAAEDADSAIAQVRYVVEKLMQESMLNDSMNFNAGTYDFLIPSHHDILLFENFMETLQKYDIDFYQKILNSQIHIIQKNHHRDAIRSENEKWVCEKIKNLD